MARQLSAEQAVPAPPVATEPAPRPDAELLPGPVAAAMLAAAVVLGAGVGVAAVLALAAPVGREPALVNLLHAMVGIKALIFAAAATLVALRLRGPVSLGSIGGYCTGLGMSAAALVWLWGLSGLLLGSALFYGGLVATYLTASKDQGLADGLRRALPGRH
jgi:NAD/NADP transhydrogenase beta subunit